MRKLIICHRSLFLRSLLSNQFRTLTSKKIVTPRQEMPKTTLASLNFQLRFVPVRKLYSLENKYHKEIRMPPTTHEIVNDYIKDICYEETYFSPEKWDEVQIDIMNNCVSLTVENFDSVLMNVLMSHNKFSLAQSFMDYLEKRKLKPNFVTLCKYMVLCSRHTNLVSEDCILQMHDKVISVVDTSIMDFKTAECLIQGLCATSKWRLAIDYLKSMRKEHWTSDALDALSCAAVRNDDHVLYWQILNTWYKRDVSPGSVAFEEYIKYQIKSSASDSKKADESIKLLLNFIKAKGIILKEAAAHLVEKYFRSHEPSKWTVIHSQVNRSGTCAACRNRLEPSVLTADEFSQLRSSFFDYSLKKSDIFINTTEEEFSRYIHFVERFKPFDIALDGLNVAYTEPRVIGENGLAEKLYSVVSHLSKNGSRILVLARYHMKKWPRPIMNAIRQKAFIFYVSNISQDDPFLIHAALISGPNALLMSSDMMRDHISRLPDSRTIYLFKKWQQSRQIYMDVGEKGESVIKGPLRHSINIQGSMESGWHIPYDNGFEREPYEELNNWICIQRIPG